MVQRNNYMFMVNTTQFIIANEVGPNRLFLAAHYYIYF